MEMKSSESRRNLLKSIAAGSGAVIAGKNLPENWTRPVVDSVLLPAHGQTSGPVPVITLSNCQINRAEQTDPTELEIDFSFSLQTDPPIDLTPDSTVDFELTFQPSNTVVTHSGDAVIDASGNATYETPGGGSLPNSPITTMPAGSTAVSVTITSLEGHALSPGSPLYGYTLIQCTTPVVTIPPP